VPLQLELIFSLLGPINIRKVMQVCRRFWRAVDENYWEARACRKWLYCDASKYGYDWRALYLDNNTQSHHGTIEWTIRNFSQLSQRYVYNPIFHIGGFPWLVRVYPKGHRNRCASCACHILCENAATRLSLAQGAH